MFENFLQKKVQKENPLSQMNNLRDIPNDVLSNFKKPINLAKENSNWSIHYKDCKLQTLDTDCDEPKWNQYSDDYIITHLPYLDDFNDLAVNYEIGAGFESPKVNDWFNSYNSIGTINYEEFRNAKLNANLRGKAFCYVKDNSLIDLSPYRTEILYIDPKKKDSPPIKAGVLVDWDLKCDKEKNLCERLEFKRKNYLLKKFVTGKSTSEYLAMESMQFIANSDLLELGDGRNPLKTNRLLIQIVLDSLNLNFESINNRFIPKLIMEIKDGFDLRYLGIDPKVMIEDPLKFKTQLEEGLQAQADKLNSTLPSDQLSIQQNAVIDKITTLPRVSTPKDYLEWAENTGIALSASIVGMHPAMLGVKNTNYATSVKPIIQSTIKTVIQPKQLLLEKQLSRAIASTIGIKNVKLKKIEYVDDIDIAKTDLIIAQTKATIQGTINSKDIATQNGDLKA